MQSKSAGCVNLSKNAVTWVQSAARASFWDFAGMLRATFSLPS